MDRYQAIWRTVCDIPYGQVATYGQIAELAGFARQARLVGYALHNIPSHSEIPWHRVINAGGRISFPVDSDAYREQRARLQAEGVTFNGQQIDLKRYRWQPSLDELLWKPPD